MKKSKMRGRRRRSKRMWRRITMRMIAKNLRRLAGAIW